MLLSFSACKKTSELVQFRDPLNIDPQIWEQEAAVQYMLNDAYQFIMPNFMYEYTANNYGMHLVSDENYYSANDNFGISVNHGGANSVVGAYRFDEGGFINQGAAYVFNTNGSNPTFRRKIDDDDGDPHGYFGFAVAISGFEIIVGAYGKNSNAGQAGFLNIQ